MGTKVFPVPTQGPLTFYFESTTKDLLNYSIVNDEGKVIFRDAQRLHRGLNNIPLDLSTLTDGVYFLEALSLNKRQKVSHRIVKIGIK